MHTERGQSSGFLIVDALLADGDRARPGHLRTEGEQIAEVLSDELSREVLTALAARHGCEMVEGRARWLVPGGIDPHVHFALPVAGTVTVDDFASGSRAALAGGTTSIIDFVTPARDEPLPAAFATRLSEAESAACDYALHASVTGWRDEIPEELATCVERFGARSVKVYLAYLETIGLEGNDLVAALAAAANLDLTVLMHCEDGARIVQRQRALLAAGKCDPVAHAHSRPPQDEVSAVEAALLLAARTGCRPYVVHVSTAGALHAIAAARAAGQEVLAETCPQYLWRDEREYVAPFERAAAAVMSPPLRPRTDRDALRGAVAAGAFDVVATDHCSFSREQKTRGRDDFTRIPGGVAGVQHRLALLHTLLASEGGADPNAWVRLTSRRPAQVFGHYPRKGCLRPGSDADLVLWDPGAVSTISASSDEQAADQSLYEGQSVRGRADHVWLRGRRVVRDAVVTAVAGSGRYLGR